MDGIIDGESDGKVLGEFVGRSVGALVDVSEYKRKDTMGKRNQIQT